MIELLIFYYIFAAYFMLGLWFKEDGKNYLGLFVLLIFSPICFPIILGTNAAEGR